MGQIITTYATGEDLLGVLLVFNAGAKPWIINSSGEEAVIAG